MPERCHNPHCDGWLRPTDKVPLCRTCRQTIGMLTALVGWMAFAGWVVGRICR